MVDHLTLMPDDTWRRPGVSVAAAASGRDGYFFVMPEADDLQAITARKVWAHYMPTWPLSIDNKNGITDSTEYFTRVWMPPGITEGSIDHAETGGYIRDRPVPRAIPPGTSGVSAFPDTTGEHWQTNDMEAEVAYAYDMGFDGFILLTQSPTTSTTSSDRQRFGPYWMLQACINDGRGMKCVLMPDVSTGSMGALSAANLATQIAQQAAYSSAYRLPDNRLVLMVYKTEAKTVAFWNDVMSALVNTHGITPAFWPCFTSPFETGSPSLRTQYTTGANYLYGLTTWGNSHATGNPIDQSTSTSFPYGQGKQTVDDGLHWCQATRIQDIRHASRYPSTNPTGTVWWEPEGSKLLRNTYTIANQLAAYDSKADFVQATTWNDYWEDTQFGPTLYNGHDTMKQVVGYFNAWYKTGVQPTITKDAVVLIHRIQPKGTNVQSAAQTLFLQLLSGDSAYDKCEALVFATEAGTLTLNSGSNQQVSAVSAGLNVVSVNIGTGAQTATLTRNSQTVVSVTSDFTVTSNPPVQDYHNRIKIGVAA